jgi:hypothetical protein
MIVNDIYRPNPKKALINLPKPKVISIRLRLTSKMLV